MPKTVVELDAYVIPKDHLVFKCSPGKTYRFYLAVRDASVVFPDIRGLETLAGAPDQWTDQELLKIISDDRWERELVSRTRGNQEHGSEGISQVDRRTLTFLKRIFFDGKKGDLVVVPVDGYAKDVLIGEFLTDSGDVRAVEARDGDYAGTYFGRPVRWRNAVQKLALSAEMIKALHTQTAVFTLGRSLHEEVYRHAYSNFVYDGHYVSEFRTDKATFTAEDMSVVSMWLNGFDVVRASTDNYIDIDANDSFYKLGLLKLEDNKSSEVRINIQSPGEISVRSATPFALAVMAIFALSGCDSKHIVDNGVTVHLKVVGSATPDVQSSVEACVDSIAAALGECRLDDANGLGKRAAVDGRVSTAAVLKNS